MIGEQEQHNITEAVKASRHVCWCNNVRKPCSYHEGMIDGVELALSLAGVEFPDLG